MLIVGVGGQGVILVSKVLAWLAQQRGYQVKQSEVHGMAKRGGSVFSHVRYGREVWSPTIARGEVDLLIALEWAEALRWLPWLKPGSGMLVCDTKRIVPPFSCLNRRPGATLRYARETPAEVRSRTWRKATRSTPHGSRRNSATNAPPTWCCSVRCRSRWSFPTRSGRPRCVEFVPAKTTVVNLEAFRLGREWIERARGGEDGIPAPTEPPAAPSPESEVRLEITPQWCKSCDICVKLCPERCLAPQRRTDRRTGRSFEVHRLPAVRMAVPRLRDPRASRTAVGH